jgi:hypothetical protein
MHTSTGIFIPVLSSDERRENTMKASKIKISQDHHPNIKKKRE